MDEHLLPPNSAVAAVPSGSIDVAAATQSPDTSSVRRGLLLRDLVRALARQAAAEAWALAMIPNNKPEISP